MKSSKVKTKKPSDYTLVVDKKVQRKVFGIFRAERAVIKAAKKWVDSTLLTDASATMRLIKAVERLNKIRGSNKPNGESV